jgi:hypothetical protein
MNVREVLAAIGCAALIGWAAPAFAIPFAVTVSNVNVNWGQGEGLTINEAGNSAGIYYAGPISLSVDGVAMTVFCDDLYNDIYIGSIDSFFQGNTTDAIQYLALLTNSTLYPYGTIQDIAGIAYMGTIDSSNTLNPPTGYQPLTPTLGAEFQLAIWELEYGNITDTADLGIQAGANELLTNAPEYYVDMLQAGYTYGQLISPCDATQPGSITHTTSCQIQGQLFLTRVPEPSTLALFGAGLIGLIGFGSLRCRTARASDATTRFNDRSW